MRPRGGDFFFHFLKIKVYINDHIYILILFAYYNILKYILLIDTLYKHMNETPIFFNFFIILSV